ncbi:MAG: hypothetical protein ACYS74_14500, partial [Planctomycetota bacterium]
AEPGKPHSYSTLSHINAFHFGFSIANCRFQSKIANRKSAIYWKSPSPVKQFSRIYAVLIMVYPVILSNTQTQISRIYMVLVIGHPVILSKEETDCFCLSGVLNSRFAGCSPRRRI